MLRLCRFLFPIPYPCARDGGEGEARPNALGFEYRRVHAIIRALMGGSLEAWWTLRFCWDVPKQYIPLTTNPVHL